MADGLIVLALSILDHQSMPRVVGVHRKGARPTVASGVTDQPIEAVLAAWALSEDRIA
jgi:hypothetical protein